MAKSVSKKNKGVSLMVGQVLPVLALRDAVVYPHMVIPLFVGRASSVAAIEAAMTQNQKLLLLTQLHGEEEDPTPDQLYSVGTLCVILQVLRLPDGTLKVLIEGETRARALNFISAKDCYFAEYEDVLEVPLAEHETDSAALLRSVLSQFDQYVKLNKKIPPEVIQALAGIDHPSRLADTIAAHLSLKLEERQKILESENVEGRIKLLMNYMESEIDILQVERRIRNRVKKQMEKTQREYYLNEQMKAIQKELGEVTGQGENETDSLDRKIKAAKMPAPAEEKALHELKKLKSMSPMSAEASVSRSYIDWMLQVPWHASSAIKKDLVHAERVLESEHYGLEKVKERILEYLAVQQRVKKMKSPILCLVGPPGVGKTSLGASIAHATGRKFVRMALGGVRDEAEIRGHRRTYVGSLPGKIIQKLTQVKTRNPLFLLDEIDKMSMDFRGDPSSALLEVLDPEQNHAFNDHYLEVDYDLSEVMFVATANSMDIPPALLDRMEVIRLSGYTEDEKFEIFNTYLVAKQLKATGLKAKEIEFDDRIPLELIRYYTREAGVRSLERELAKICRKAVRLIQSGRYKKVTVSPDNLEEFLGVRRYRYGLADEENQVGQVTGLAWTEVGGELLKIETALVPGKGKYVSTGKLGEVMQESIKAAITVVRARAEQYHIPVDFYEKSEIHIHLPEGATPKDGPSAGISICTALVSVLTGRKVRANVAMTGEITLRGEVTAIGGLKEKLLAARRGGIKTVIIPVENMPDLKEIPAKIKDPLEIIPVRWIDQVLEVALEKESASKKIS